MYGKCTYLQKVISRKTFLFNLFLSASWRSMTKTAESGSASGSGSESGFLSQRHGSPDPDPDPDPHQNVMDPQHCNLVYERKPSTFTFPYASKSLYCNETDGRRNYNEREFKLSRRQFSINGYFMMWKREITVFLLLQKFLFLAAIWEKSKNVKKGIHFSSFWEYYNLWTWIFFVY